jgi:hypothetical protein
MEEISRPQIKKDYNERWLPVIIRTRSLTIIEKPGISFEEKTAGDTLSDFADIAGEYSAEDDYLQTESLEPDADISLDEWIDTLGEGQEDLPQEEQENKTSSLFIQLQEMTVAKKVEFAMKCNKEARTILIRDRNRLVQMSVIKSPKITETEVVMIANNRSVHEDVLRYISTQREWMKNYEVRVGLVFNPKTPLFISTKQVYFLKDRELSKLGKSKSVPRVLSVAAVRRLHEVKR